MSRNTGDPAGWSREIGLGSEIVHHGVDVRTLGPKRAVTGRRRWNSTLKQEPLDNGVRRMGYGRLARQARFKGEVVKGCEYVMVDDFIGQGGTLANLRGWIEQRGGRVVGAVALTGKPYSATLNPSQEQLHELRERHGPDFEKWWREHFGHTFDCLTQSECRYLARSPDVDTIRNRLAEAQQDGNGPAGARSPREQKRHIADLKARLRDRFPDGPPATPLRPIPARWQGYDRHPEDDSTDTHHSVFDPRIIVLGIKDKQVSLPATLKLTAALRGLLMGACPEQPPPEWFSAPRRHAHLCTASGTGPSSIRGFAACGRADHGVGAGSASGAGPHGGWALP